ncbi:MAG: hypothetical protein ACI311_02790 [Bacilli bacterium]
MESNFDFLTVNVCRSKIIDNEENLLKLEKVEKLNKQELTSLSRYIGEFDYCESIDPIINNVIIKQKNEEINVKLIPVFPNEFISDEINFYDFSWNEVIANENFIKKYNSNDLTITFETTINVDGFFEFVSFNDDIEVLNYHKNIDFDSTPYLYMNVLKFNSFLDSIILENISSYKHEYYSLLDALKDDDNGENFNSYNYILGLKSADDFYELLSISESNNIELTSNPIIMYQSNKSTFDLVELVSKFFLYTTSFSIMLICIIQIHITILNKIKDIGYLLSIGMKSDDVYIIIFESIFKEFIKAVFLDFIIIVFIYLIVSFIFPIDTIINFGTFFIYLICTYAMIGSLIFLITNICFTFLINKKISALLREE